MNAIAANIKKLRKSHGMTQDGLAERLHVTHQAVSNWETGKTQPDAQTLAAIAEIFGVSIEEVIYGEAKPQGIAQRVVTRENAEKGVSFGTVLAMVISYAHWHSIGWAIVHGVLGWVYVVYYCLKYLD